MPSGNDNHICDFTSMECIKIAIAMQNKLHIRWNGIVVILMKLSSLAAPKSCQIYNFRYSQWRRFHQNVDSSVSVLLVLSSYQWWDFSCLGEIGWSQLGENLRNIGASQGRLLHSRLFSQPNDTGAGLHQSRAFAGHRKREGSLYD